MDNVWSHLSRIGRWYSSILFSTRPSVGLCVFLATVGNPDLGIAALLCGHLAHGFARLFEFPQADVEGGGYGCNGILYGLFVGSHFVDPVLALTLAVGGSFLVCLVTRAFTNTAGWYLRIPACSYPFVVTTLLVSHLTWSQERQFGADIVRPFSYSSGAMESFLGKPFHLTFSEKAAREGLVFVGSVGAILFQHSMLPCVMASVALFLSSRVIFLITVAGFLFVRFLLALLPFNTQGQELLVGFNAILIAISIGGAFFLPGLKSFALMLLAQAGGLLVGFSLNAISRGSGAEFTALPFNLMVSGAFLMLQGRAFGARPFPPVLSFASPEEAINYYRRYSERIFYRAIALPVFGEWQVVQGFDGAETHKEQWRYGIDLAAVDEDLKRFRSTGVHCEDYYAFNAPVRSPVNGVVAVVWDQVTDNVLGGMNLREPWGNFVLVYSIGVYVGLYHLRRGSVAVVPGQPVVIGTPLGRVGNSGRSALPHLHLQIQMEAHAGSASLPFLLQDVVMREDEASLFLPFVKPVEGTTLRDALPAEAARTVLCPRQGEEWILDIVDRGKRRATTWRFRYSLQGDVVVSDGDEEIEFRLASRSVEVLRFSRRSLSPLNLFAISLADLPYDRFAGLRWRATLYGKSAHRFLDRWKRALTFIAGEVFSVLCHKEIVEDDATLQQEPSLVTVRTRFSGDPRAPASSRPTLVARFGLEGFRDLSLDDEAGSSLSCRRVLPPSPHP
ncbi:MAG: urea transporter [Candidatus Riflebacteria bacterium]|nr:urea transporter [Candidatus Riflebacteria bacterium]